MSEAWRAHSCEVNKMVNRNEGPPAWHPRGWILGQHWSPKSSHRHGILSECCRWERGCREGWPSNHSCWLLREPHPPGRAMSCLWMHLAVGGLCTSWSQYQECLLTTQGHFYTSWDTSSDAQPAHLSLWSYTIRGLAFKCSSQSTFLRWPSAVMEWCSLWPMEQQKEESQLDQPIRLAG